MWWFHVKCLVIVFIFKDNVALAGQKKKKTCSSEKTIIYEAYNNDETHPNKSIRDVTENLEKWPPGKNGLGISLNVSALTTKEAKRRDSMFQEHGFDVFVSKLIPLNRMLPDFRGQWCKDEFDHVEVETLPRVSIIICFYNEAWSTLLRSIHSIVNRTPKELLQEIILVDDKSHLSHLGVKLVKYIKEHFEKNLVKIIRLKNRQGLIRARLAGINKSSGGQVLVFLDSHIEVTQGWLEPLLVPIRDDYTKITCPIIDNISSDQFYYHFVNPPIVGMIDWQLKYRWESVIKAEEEENIWTPVGTPIMAGGIFAINKAFFKHLGYYDEGLKIWGGENLELSFKGWMCGGSIQTIPCSRVGHVFRKFSTYAISYDEIYYNNLRVAEVWMDDFKYIYYSQLGEKDEYIKMSYGDVSKRRQLRQELKCQPFKWFLDKVMDGRMPYFDHDHIKGAGEIRNLGNGYYCLDGEQVNNPIFAAPCHGHGRGQYWVLSSSGFLVQNVLCTEASSENLLILMPCHNSFSTWSFDPETRQIQSEDYNKCLTLKSSGQVSLQNCDADNEDQLWTFSNFSRKEIANKDLVAEHLHNKHETTHFRL